MPPPPPTHTQRTPTQKPQLTWLRSCRNWRGTRRAISHIAQFQMKGSVPKRALTPWLCLMRECCCCCCGGGGGGERVLLLLGGVWALLLLLLLLLFWEAGCIVETLAVLV